MTCQILGHPTPTSISQIKTLQALVRWIRAAFGSRSGYTKTAALIARADQPRAPVVTNIVDRALPTGLGQLSEPQLPCRDCRLRSGVAGAWSRSRVGRHAGALQRVATPRCGRGVAADRGLEIKVGESSPPVARCAPHLNTSPDPERSLRAANPHGTNPSRPSRFTSESGYSSTFYVRKFGGEP